MSQPGYGTPVESKLVWANDIAKPRATPAQPRIQGDEPALEQAGQGYVLGIGGLRPPELVGEVPGLGTEFRRRSRTDPAPLQADPGQDGIFCFDLAPPGHFVEHRTRL